MVAVQGCAAGTSGRCLCSGCSWTLLQCLLAVMLYCVWTSSAVGVAGVIGRAHSVAASNIVLELTLLRLVSGERVVGLGWRGSG